MEIIGQKKQIMPAGPEETLSMHPKKFALWLFIVSILMIFAALSSAYMVRKGDGNWLEFEMPSMFWISTVVILTSSLTLQWGVHKARKNEIKELKVALTITFLLGIIFIIMQYQGWQDLQLRRIWLGGQMSNPAGSFIYVITGLHVFHLITGIVFLMIVIVASFQDKIHAKSMNGMEMCATYWHFLGLLWVYILVFFFANK